MALERLLFKPDFESNLVRKVSDEILKKYLAYKDLYIFMKLEKLGQKKSQGIWVKIFSDPHSLEKFYLDTKMQRACIIIGQDKRKVITVDMFGFYEIHESQIYPDKIVKIREYDSLGNIEDDSMPTPAELNQMTNLLNSVVVNGHRKKSA